MRIICAALLAAIGCGGGQAATTNGEDTAGPTDPVENTVDGDQPEATGVLPPGERTEGMIATNVWQAIADNDVDLAVAYAPSMETLGESCPEMWANPRARAEIEREMSDMRPAITEAFAECRQMLDFGAVDPREPEWERITDNDDCSGVAIIANGRITVDAGPGLLELRIQVVTLRDGRVYLADSPRCWLDDE